jgi:hypothetical protein
LKGERPRIILQRRNFQKQNFEEKIGLQRISKVQKNSLQNKKSK